MIKNPYEWRTIFTHTQLICTLLIFYFTSVSFFCQWMTTIDSGHLDAHDNDRLMEKLSFSHFFFIYDFEKKRRRQIFQSISRTYTCTDGTLLLPILSISLLLMNWRVFFYRNLKDWLWLITTSLLFDDAKREILSLLLLLWLSFLYIFFAFFFLHVCLCCNICVVFYVNKIKWSGIWEWATECINKYILIYSL